MLDQLPPELLNLIVDEVSFESHSYSMFFDQLQILSTRDRQSVSLVSRYLYKAVSSRLYESLEFSAQKEWAVNHLNIRRFFDCISLQCASTYLQRTKHLRFTAPIRFARLTRCAYRCAYAHVSTQNESTPVSWDYSASHRVFLDDLREQLHPVFERLSPNALHSF